LNVKERAMAAILGEEPDKIPWLIYPVTFARPFPADLDSIRNLPLWRELRSKGLGLSKSMPVYRIIRPHVKVKKIRKGNIVITMFQTPVGNLTMRDKEIQNFPEGSITWRMEYPIKSLQDYEVFKFIVEDTEYQPDYKLFIAEEQKMDGDGIVKAGCPKSPPSRGYISPYGLQEICTRPIHSSKRIPGAHGEYEKEIHGGILHHC